MRRVALIGGSGAGTSRFSTARAAANAAAAVGRGEGIAVHRLTRRGEARRPPARLVGGHPIEASARSHAPV